MGVLKYFGYAAFFFAAFLVGLYQTFPWNVAKDRIFDLVRKQSGVQVTADALEPDWVTGVDARGVKIRLRGGGDPIALDRVQVRAKLIPIIQGKIGVSAHLPIAQGDVEADVVVGDELIEVEANVSGVQLALVSALEAAGMPLSGKTSLVAHLTVGKKDPKLTNGQIELRIEGLKAPEGTKVGMISLPREMDFGTVALSVPVKNGTANLKGTRISGNDVEITVDGTIQPLFPLPRTSMNLSVGLKPTKALLDSEPLLKAILKNFERAKGADGFYGIAITGTLDRPRVQPRRG